MEPPAPRSDPLVGRATQQCYARRSVSLLAARVNSSLHPPPLAGDRSRRSAATVEQRAAPEPASLRSSTLLCPSVAMARGRQVRLPALDGAEVERRAHAIAGGDAACVVRLSSGDRLAADAAYLPSTRRGHVASVPGGALRVLCAARRLDQPTSRSTPSGRTALARSGRDTSLARALFRRFAVCAARELPLEAGKQLA